MENPHCGASGVPFMKSRTALSRISSSTLSLRVGSVIDSHYTQLLRGHRGPDGERVDRAVVEASLDGLLDELLLLDPREALELGRADRCAQVVLGAGLVDDLDLGPGQAGLDHQPHLVVRDRHGSGGGLGGLRGLDKLLDAAELHPRAPMGLAGLDLGRVDRLPALEGDVVGLALVEQRLDRGCVTGELRLRNLPGLEVGEQLVDGFLRVLLVGPDHARGAALDPTDGVEAGHLPAIAVVDPTAVVVDQAASVVERDALDRDALVSDRAQDQAALDRLALASVDGAEPPGVVALQLIAADHDPLHLAVTLDLDGGAKEAHHDPLALPLWLALREVGEDL